LKAYQFGPNNFKINISAPLFFTIVIGITGFLFQSLLYHTISLFLSISTKLLSLLFISILLHELGHLLTAFLLKRKISALYLGIVFSGVEIENEESDIKYAFILLTGPLVNLLIYLIIVLINVNDYYIRLAANLNLIIFVSNIIPLLSFNDGFIVLEIFLKKVRILNNLKAMHIKNYTIFILLGLSLNNEFSSYFILQYLILEMIWNE
jgi:hypothetical protein